MQTDTLKLPEKFIERLHQIVPKESFTNIFHSFSQKKPSTFRANTLKITAFELENELAKLNILVDKIPWYENAFILKNVPQKTLMETEFYKNGYLYIQGLSSMIPALILDPKPHEKVLDIAAAPGSKTTQIASMMANTGEILANDKSHIRNYKLKANITMQGITNTHITQFPGQILWKKLPEYFDKVLVDVPCSMEGRFSTEFQKSFRDWSPTKITYLEEIQKYILRSAISCAKPGGTIVYSTCTLAPEENESVIDWILKKEKENVMLEKVTLLHFQFDASLLSWKNKKYHPLISNTARIYPTAIYEGFFIAKIKKLKTTINEKII